MNASAKINRYVGVFTILFSLLMVFVVIPQFVPEVTLYGTSSRLFPYVTTVVLGFLGLAQLINKKQMDEKQVNLSLNELSRVAFAITITALYILSIKVIGFVFGTVIMLAVMIKFFGESRWVYVLMTSVVATFTILLLLQTLLRIRLPRGIFF